MHNFNKNLKSNLKEGEKITKVHMVNVIKLIQMYERRAVKMQDSGTSNILPSRNKRKKTIMDKKFQNKNKDNNK